MDREKNKNHHQGSQDKNLGNFGVRINTISTKSVTERICVLTNKIAHAWASMLCLFSDEFMALVPHSHRMWGNMQSLEQFIALGLYQAQVQLHNLHSSQKEKKTKNHSSEKWTSYSCHPPRVGSTWIMNRICGHIIKDRKIGKIVAELLIGWLDFHYCHIFMINNLFNSSSFVHQHKN